MSTVFKIDRKKWENFWYYYKIHVIVGVFIAILLAITLRDCANNIEPDLTIAYMGKNYISEEIGQVLKDQLSKVLADVNNDERVELSFLPIILTDDIKSETDIAMQQKAMIVIASGEAQMFLLDSSNLKKLISQGALQPLDDVVSQYNIDIEQYPEIKATAEGEQEPHIYGLPLDGNRIFEEKGLQTEDLYIAIRVMSQGDQNKAKVVSMYDNAFRALDAIMKSF